MSRPLSLALGLALLATVVAAAVAGAQGLAYAGCGWGVLLLAAACWRLPKMGFDRSRNGLVWTFIAANMLWLAADVLSIGRGEDHVFPTPAGVFAVAGTVLFAVVITWVSMLRGLRRDAASDFDGATFGAALFAPLWYGLVAPQGAPLGLVVALAGWLVLMSFGGKYILGGGKWNVPAVLLALGVVFNVFGDIAIHVAEATGATSAAAAFGPRHLPGFILFTFVALHPRLAEVFESGHRVEGVPLEIRCRLLPLCVVQPIAVIAYAYVVGDPLPAALAAGTVAVMVVFVGIRAALLYIDGYPEWHVPLMISVATLTVGAGAVALTTFGQSALKSRTHADALSATLPVAEQLDGLVLRATSGADSLAEPAQAQWPGVAARLGRSVAGTDPRTRPSTTQYLRVAGATVAAARAGDTGVTVRQAEREVRPAHSAMLAEIRGAVTSDRAEARAVARRSRILSVGALFGTLVAVTLLLLRFASQGRRLERTHLEVHDGLTGLPNRTAMERRLQAGAGGAGQALVLLDLDDFKAVNDAKGHPVGDELLCALATRLDGLTRGDELLARVDGDAFAILVDGTADAGDAAGAAQRMHLALAEPVLLDGEPHTLHGSIGIAVAQGADYAADRAAIMLRDAELAMYEAKRVRGNSIEVFAPEMHDAARQRIELAADLRRAIGEGELHLVYQPIVDITSGQTFGYEALVRWQHPTQGFMSPADFIPVAERTGLIVDLGGWVLGEACRQMQSWSRELPGDRYVSVNVAAEQLGSGVLAGQVDAALRDSGLAPDRLLLEVTESSLIENLDAGLRQMDEVRRHGVRFALDDFGTGYSSLSYLRRFPVDVLKVDKAFIDDVVDEDGGSLVAAIVTMANSLRLRVVAEGIEEDEQAAALRAMGCDLGQGYRYSRPLPADDIPGTPDVLGPAPEPPSSLRLAG